MKYFAHTLTWGVILLTHLLHAQTIYIGPASGDWGDAANWSAGVPTAGDNVIVDSRGQNSTVSTGISQTRNVLDLDINAGDSVLVSNNSTLNINGSALDLDGELRIGSTSAGTSVRFNSETTLSGSGSLALSTENNNSRLRGAGTLINFATIEGRGNLGFNELAIVNAAGGVIDANVLSPGALLFVDPRAADGLINLGMMQSSDGGVLQLSGNGGGEFNNTGGVIQAIGAGSEVQLFTNASIINGTIHTDGGGLIRGNTSDNYFFTDVTFDTGTQVVANNNSDFGVLGTITNDGTITIAATSAGTDIELQGDTAFAGSGEIVLGIDNNNARINGTGTLTNTTNHTIRGRGNLGSNVLAIVNDGTITSDAAGGNLFIDPSPEGLDNNATLQVINGGTMQLSGNGGGEFDNNGSLIQAIGAGSEVQLLTNASIINGTIHTDGGGLIQGNTSDNYFFTDVTFDTGTQVVANNNSDFGVLGTITNDGTITIAATSAGTDIELQGDTAFAGNGSVVLGIDNNNARINGTGTLTNTTNHTIRGRGNLGSNVLAIVNDGTITSDAAGGNLLIDPSLEGLDNNATLQVINGGTMQLSGNGGGKFDNNGSLIQAIGAGSEVQLLTNVSIINGTIHTDGGGLIRGNTSQNYFFTDVTFDAGTQVRADNNSDFGVLGTITNDGTITIAATSAGTDIELQGDTAFAGSGEIVLGIDNNNARINGAGTLTNTTQHSIRGRGNVGFNTLAIVNDGTITSDAAGGNLLIDPSLEGLDNNATLQVINGGTMQLSGNGGGEFDNDGSLIQAIGEGSEVLLLTNASIVGGTFHTEDGGLIRGNTSDKYFFTDVTFDTGTQVVANNNSDFGVLGTITNEGTITIAATSAGTDIELQGDTAFVGSGEIVLGTVNNNARINGTGTLTNTNNHTIHGRGNLGFNTISVFNAPSGTIMANVDGAALLIDSATGVGTFANRGLLASSNGGVLQLSGNGGGSFDNTGGVIKAGDGSQVQLLTNLSIDGGSLETEGSGLMRLNVSQTATISNADISGAMAIENNSTLTLSGNLTHSGDLAINATSAGTSLFMDSFLDLQGGGTISMNGVNARILGNGVLINHDHEILGLGSIGFNQAAITNTVGGTIHANTAGGTLSLDPNVYLGLVNDGTLRASSGGTLQLNGNGGGQFTLGETGVVEALSGGSVTHLSNAVLTNLKDGILTDGTYRAVDATLNLPGESIITNAAKVELSGTNASFAQLNTLELNSGELSVAKGASLNLAGDFTQSASGSLDVSISGKPVDRELWGSVIAAGAAVLDGVLNVVFNVGSTFSATVGDAWQFLTSASRQGEFAEVSITAEGLPANGQLAVNYLDDGVELAVVQVAGLNTALTFESWAAALPHGVDPDPNADPDGDGASNLEEYAFGMDATMSDPWLLPQPSLVRANGLSYVAIHYMRPSASETRSDVTYLVETSEDLLKWNTTEVLEQVQATEDERLEVIEARCASSISSTNASMMFLRIALHRIPPAAQLETNE